MAAGDRHLCAALVRRRRRSAGDHAGDGVRRSRRVDAGGRDHRSGRRRRNRPASCRHAIVAALGGGTGATARRCRRCAALGRCRLRRARSAISDSTGCSIGWKPSFRARAGDALTMCGIAGLFRATRDRARARRANDGGAAPARPGRRAHARSGRQRSSARAAPAPNAMLHTRLSIIDPRPEADQPMDNAAGDVWISYNGEVYDWAADAETLEVGRIRLPHALRHRIHPACLRALGDRLRCAAARDVRDRDPRFAAARPVRHSRPARPEAGRLRASRRRLRVRFDHARTAAMAAAATRAAFSAEGIDAYLAHRTIPAPRTIFSHIRAAAARALAALRPRDGQARNARVLAAGAFRRTVAADARCGNPHAHRRRPSARTLPVVGRRFVGASPAGLRRWVSTGCEASPPHFPGTPFDESALARAAAERLGFPNLAVTIPEAHRRRLRAPRRRSRRAVRRPFVRADVVSRARNDASRQGRAGRRRRRRALRRLQALREALAHALAPRPRAAQLARARGFRRQRLAAREGGAATRLALGVCAAVLRLYAG